MCPNFFSPKGRSKGGMDLGMAGTPLKASSISPGGNYFGPPPFLLQMGLRGFPVSRSPVLMVVGVGRDLVMWGIWAMLAWRMVWMLWTVP